MSVPWKRGFAVLIALIVVTAVSVAWTVEAALPTCQKCDEDICDDPNELGFYGNEEDVAAMCTLTSCCAETSASCAELISCPGEEDDAEEFAYETVPEFVTAVEEMSPTALVELLEHHPRRVAYHAPRNSVVLTGCSGVVKALLPITADQLAAVVAADL